MNTRPASLFPGTLAALGLALVPSNHGRAQGQWAASLRG